MTNIEISDKSTEVQTSFVRALLKGYLAVERNRQRRRCMAEIHALNDHTLRDIGLQRTDITSASATARTGK
ncbi:MAG TPA: DUF1127 domain-containing protein [Kiloniellaceae bacterium]|nr:DUF1127 domain-containing protein [Kiloniellaceae bacterium]